MADERVRELLRELRERYGIALVPAPGAELLRDLQGRAWEKVGPMDARRLTEQAKRLQEWLSTFGDVPARCSARSRAYKIPCERPVGHDGLHMACGFGWGPK